MKSVLFVVAVGIGTAVLTLLYSVVGEQEGRIFVSLYGGLLSALFVFFWDDLLDMLLLNAYLLWHGIPALLEFLWAVMVCMTILAVAGIDFLYRRCRYNHALAA